MRYTPAAYVRADIRTGYSCIGSNIFDVIGPKSPAVSIISPKPRFGMNCAGWMHRYNQGGLDHDIPELLFHASHHY